MSLLDELVQMLGSQYVLTGDDAQPYTVDWRGRYSGSALAVVKPGSTQEVAQVVRWCVAHGVPMVPQGGNTGLCGGATPDSTGAALVISLTRLNAIRSVDTDNKTMVVDAGWHRKSGVEGTSVSVRVRPGGRRRCQKQNT